METLAEQARSSLERMIVFNELDADGMYSEKQLAAMLCLGRTPVREALQKLSYDKMVVIHPRRGVQFPKVTVENQLKVLELRRGIEPFCVRYAAIRGTVDQKGQMLRLADAIVAAARVDDDAGILVCLREIHDLLAHATSNDFFSQVMAPLQGLSRRFWFVNKKSPDTVRGAKLHADIMQAVAKGDEEGAVNASNQLIDYLTEFAYDTLKLAS